MNLDDLKVGTEIVIDRQPRKIIEIKDSIIEGVSVEYVMDKEFELFGEVTTVIYSDELHNFDYLLQVVEEDCDESNTTCES